MHCAFGGKVTAESKGDVNIREKTPEHISIPKSEDICITIHFLNFCFLFYWVFIAAIVADCRESPQLQCVGLLPFCRTWGLGAQTSDVSWHTPVVVAPGSREISEYRSWVGWLAALSGWHKGILPDQKLNPHVSCTKLWIFAVKLVTMKTPPSVQICKDIKILPQKICIMWEDISYN